MSSDISVRLGTAVGPGPDDIEWDRRLDDMLVDDDVAWFWAMVAQAALVQLLGRVRGHMVVTPDWCDDRARMLGEQA